MCALHARCGARQVGKNYELLNCDDHANFLRRHGKDPAQYRPDIAHQVRRGGRLGGLGEAARGPWHVQAIYVGSCGWAHKARRQTK